MFYGQHLTLSKVGVTNMDRQISDTLLSFFLFDSLSLLVCCYFVRLYFSNTEDLVEEHFSSIA